VIDLQSGMRLDRNFRNLLIIALGDYLRRDGTLPMTGNLDLDGNRLILDADGDSYIVSSIDDEAMIVLGGVEKYQIQGSFFGCKDRAGFINRNATANSPGVVPEKSDDNSGVAWPGADMISVAVGDVEAIRWTEDANKLETWIKGSLAKNHHDLNAATYTITQEDYFIECRYTATGAITALTLPSIATLAKSYEYVIIDSGNNANTNNITVVRNGTDEINHVAGNYVINVDGASITLKANVTTSNWEII